MTHIAFIIPHMCMQETVHAAWSLHEKIFGVDRELSYTVYCAIMPNAVDALNIKADVIVSRGGTAAALKKRQRLRPVIEIPVTSSDLTTSILHGLKLCPEGPVGLVGSVNTIRGFFCMEPIEGIEVRPYLAASIAHADVEDGMKKAISDGCKLIISGNTTTRYCQEHNIPCGLIESSVESIFLSIIEAKRCAGAVEVEKENSLTFRSVIDHVTEGIVTVDEHNIVRTFNPVAAQMLGRKAEDCIGKMIQTVLPEGRILSMITGRLSCSNEIVRIGGSNCLFSCMPLDNNGRKFGVLATFTEAQEINNAATRLRERMKDNGHRARYSFSDIMGDSAPMRVAVRQAIRYAHVGSNILLMGESGTGKELFAQSIHNESDRRDNAFVAVNCAALPQNLMESELFGYEGGAFTGASKLGKEGLFEAAHNGTIFLDEISEIPLLLQSRLLRVIQEREVRRVGSNHVIPINVRIICASNRNLASMIRENRFREDLYYRLNVLSVQLPPLREREDDIPMLMQHYLSLYAARFGNRSVTLTPEAAELACRYAWPGNIRELRNVCEQLAVLSDNDEVSADDLAMVLPSGNSIPADPTSRSLLSPARSSDLSLQNLESDRIRQVLLKTGSRKEAAEILGISKTTLWRRCKELGIE